jgi:hypothetical protein
MRAHDHTASMLDWWSSVGIGTVDLAVRRDDATMIWHRDVAPSNLPLAWARAENAHRADVYIRPARGHSWPLVFLDDLTPASAQAIARKYDTLVVHTSAQGGCHVWLRCTTALDEHERRTAQRWLAQRVNADPGSTSGEHLGRLAGFKNFKRRGVWVNVLDASLRSRPWRPQLDGTHARGGHLPPRTSASGTDTSASGREWGWVCGLLESGWNPDDVYFNLVEHARPRRGSDAERYARRTLARALAHISPRIDSPQS